MNNREIAGVKVVVSGETYDEYKGTLQEQIENLQSKIDKAIEYLTSYDAISTIQGLDNIKKNKELDENTMNIMTNRYLEVHHKLLDILNDEVEIPDDEDEEKEIPEKLEYEVSDENGEFSINGFTFDFEQKIQIIKTVNEIIDFLKQN